MAKKEPRESSSKSRGEKGGGERIQAEEGATN